MFNNELLPHHIEILRKIGLSLNHLWIIEKWIKGDKVENKDTKKLRELYWIKDDELTAIATECYNGLMNTPAPIGSKKVKVIETKYDEEWRTFWHQWPAMRTFQWKGRQFICHKPFKGSEQKMKQKYITAIEKGITPETLNKAALTALSWCMENSYRKGRNEMEYHSGMEPWLNQEQYNKWIGVEMPREQGEYITDSNCG